MPDIISSAGAAGTDGATVVTANADQLQVMSPEDRIARAAAVMFGDTASPAPATTQAQAAPAAPAPEAPKNETPLAQVIRANREARQAAQAAEANRSSTAAELKQARDELARMKADRDAFEADPVGYAKARKWTPEQQLLYGQSLLYDLAPDKADPDFRIKMFEDRQKREAADREKAEQERQAKAQAEQAQAQVQEFYQDTAAAVRTFGAGSYPESEDYFGGDFNTYMASLMATAKNVADAATRQGKVADLRPAALAALLEAETARKMAERDARKQARAPQTQAQGRADAGMPAGGMQSIETLSARNMTGAGTPRPPATDDKERIRRAAEVAFRSK